jgi:hypothetical protein
MKVSPVAKIVHPKLYSSQASRECSTDHSAKASSVPALCILPRPAQPRCKLFCYNMHYLHRKYNIEGQDLALFIPRSPKPNASTNYSAKVGLIPSLKCFAKAILVPALIILHKSAKATPTQSQHCLLPQRQGRPRTNYSTQSLH